MFPKDNDAQISRFWEKYIEKSKRYGIKQDIIRWHVKHAELYIKTYKTRLKEHTALDLDKYLQDKGRNMGLKDNTWDRSCLLPMSHVGEQIEL